MPELMSLTFTPDGTGQCLYDETIDLRAIGTLTCTRASHIEFNEQTQEWEVLTPDRERVLSHSPLRTDCLTWERAHLVPSS